VGPEGVIVAVVTVALLILLFTGKASLDLLGLGLLVVLVGAGELLRLVDPAFVPEQSLLGAKQAVLGFATPAILTIAALFVVSEGLSRTGALEVLARIALHASGGRPFLIVLGVGLIAGILSAFLNDTAVVLVLLPVVLDLSRRTGVPVSRMMIPLAYASLLGGMCTLVGTSTNLLVSDAAERNGLAPMKMFEMSAIGFPLMLAGVVFMALTAKRLLPNRPSLTAMLAEAPVREYVTELTIGPNSPLLGRTYQEAFSAVMADVVFFARKEEMHWPPYFGEAIQPGDVVMLRGTADSIAALQDELGLRLFNEDRFDPRSMQFFELAVAPGSSMIGRRIRDLHLFRDYGVATVAVLRGAHHIRERASDLPLMPGDLLLVVGDQSSQEKVRGGTDFYLLTGTDKTIRLRVLARRAVLVAVAMVVAFSALSIAGRTDLLPFAALVAAAVSVGSGCLTARRAYRSIEWPLLLFIIGTLGLSEAMRNSGLAESAAHGLVSALDSFGPLAVLAGLSAFCMVGTAIMSNNAIGVLVTPIAILAARELAPLYPEIEAEPLARAFMLTVAFSASASFATHWGHQVNLMVYGPGGYRPSDFLRAGLPMTVLAWAAITFGVGWTSGLV
jgi:di/tricarboxylate transporter